VDICFFGGEPLLNYPVMKEVVPYAREKAAIGGKRVAFNLTTNGTLLTDEIISFLKEEQIVPVVSVDGPPEYHNRQRPFRNGRGSYDRIHANIQELRAVFPHLTARATVHDDADPFRIKQGLEQIGFTACFLVRASPSLLDIQNAATRSEEIEEQAMRRMVAFNRKEIDQLLAAIRKREINRVCPPSLFLPLVAIHSAQKSYHGCAIGKKRVVISVNGDIYPCASFVGQEQMRMGNIAHYQVKGLNEYHQAVVDSLPECKSCWARYFCGGGCFYRSKAYTGDMHRPATLDCIERKEMLKGLIHIYCQLDDHDKEYLKNISQGDNDHQLRSS
jgi:uncharacterized protein